MPKPYLESAGLLTFAHRGGAALAPENTLAAFRRGLEHGCELIETDVHLTRDGHVVCIHDSDLRRTTNGRGFVWDYTLAELRRFDAGYWFRAEDGSFPFRGQGLSVPTLAEALELSPTLRINLEIKQRSPSMIAALWRFIDERRLHERVLVASEQDQLVREFRNLARGTVATSAGKREIFTFWLSARAGMSDMLPIEYEALQVPVSYRGLQVLDAEFVRAAHRRGVQVHVWTIDDWDEMRRLIGLGVDAIMTDRPDRLAALARELGLSTSTGADSLVEPRLRKV